MRVLLAPHGTRGDVQPMLALAHGLRARGHHVRFVAPSNFVGWIREHGYAAESDGVDVEALLRSAGVELQSTRYQVRYVRDELAPRLFETVPRAAAGAELIVGAGVQIAAASVAEREGIPCVSACFCPCVMPSDAAPPPTVRSQRLPSWMNRLLWRVGLPLANLALRRCLNDGRARLGLPPRDRPLDAIIGSGAIVAADRELAPAGNSGAGLARTDAWVLDDRRAPDDRIEAFLAAGPPPVYVGFGSMVPADRARVQAAVAGAVRTIGCRAIVAGGWAGLETAESDRLLPILEAPHASLFPRVAAVVHHAGAGTTTAAARAGKPQVALPHILDQFYWASRIERLGIGPAPIPIEKITAAALAARVARVLGEPSFAARAAELGARIACRNGVADAVRVLEALVERRRSQV